MEQIFILLADVKAVTLKDLSTLPTEHLHTVALRLEQLQEELDRALNPSLDSSPRTTKNSKTQHHQTT